jgi:hypothetical protein
VEACKDLANVGSATFRTVRSTPTASTATESATNAHHRLPTRRAGFVQLICLEVYTV